MSSKLRRFEVLLPLQFNDGRPVPTELLSEATFEVAERFGAISFESQGIEGVWRHEGVIYRDNLAKLIVDVPDAAKNRDWMKRFKSKWKAKLEQLEIWLVSYPIEVD